MFKDFKKEVLEFIREKKSVTWRMLNERFHYDAYHISMAVELLNGKEIIVEEHKIPERIVVKECEHKWKKSIDWDGNEKSSQPKICKKCGFEKE